MTEKIQETEIKKTRLRLSERLKLVASFVPEGSRIADIGTDHGYVPIYLAEIGKIKSALAMDVRKGPLARADEHIEEYRHDVGDAAISIETRLSNGLEKLQAKEADTVIIAGMGGELEISILEAGKQLWSSIRHWIFSPQSDLEKFRRYLKENGFFIENEAMILDEGKFYTVIKAGFGTNEKDACVCKTLPEYRFGAVLIKRRDAVLKQIEYEHISILAPVTIADIYSYRRYLKEYPALYENQIKDAGTIFLSKSEQASAEEKEEARQVLAGINPTATIYTDHYSSLPEKDWLRLLETGYDGRLYQVKAEETENLPDTFSIENAYFSSPESLLIFLEDLIRGQYGNIFRAKGQILAGSQWFQFDVADSRYGITGCEPQKTGKAVFIGTEIHRQPIRRVVLSKMIQKKIVVKKR